MVFCRECQKKVDDCPHCVYPIRARRVSVFDAKIETIAYDEKQRILEIAFKSGQVWQLAAVPPSMVAELSEFTISSFLRFIAKRYKASPVKTGVYAIAVPKTEPCPICQTAMMEQNRTAGALNKFIRIFWLCPQCKKSKWESYGSIPVRQRSERWH
jgi:hypothetical protein